MKSSAGSLPFYLLTITDNICTGNHVIFNLIICLSVNYLLILLEEGWYLLNNSEVQNQDFSIIVTDNNILQIFIYDKNYLWYRHFFLIATLARAAIKQILFYAKL